MAMIVSSSREKEVLLYEELTEICDRDDVEDFIWITYHKEKLYKPLQVVECVMTSNAVKCAEALLTGKTSIHLVDKLNTPFRQESGKCPIHLAAFLHNHPCLVELLLSHGASADLPFIPGVSDRRTDLANMLPLEITIKDLVVTVINIPQWSLGHGHYSVYTLIMLLCLPDMQDELETVALLAGKTRDAEQVFIRYAKRRMIIESAILLMVDHRRFLNVVDRVWQHYDSLHMEYDEIDAMRHLVEVFESAGDDISAYIKQDKFNVTKFHAISYIQNVLNNKGFHHKFLEADFYRFKWYRRDKDKILEGPDNGDRCLCDFGMSHYAKSGFRWKASIKDPWLRYLKPEDYINELEKEIEGLEGESTNKIKKKQESCDGKTEVALDLPLCSKIQIDEKQKSILEKDDLEQLISAIQCNVDCFPPGKLLRDVCVSGAIKCAEALLTGKTPLAVGVDVRCPETGLYPLHFAALSMLPSITELFLYHDFQSKISAEPPNWLDIFPANLVEKSTGKLPLHMALLQISGFPWIREWTHDQSFSKLLTIFCLPRMQNPLETLGLLVRATSNIEHEIEVLARENKIVELAALLMVGPKMLIDVAKSINVDLYNEAKSISDKVHRKSVKAKYLALGGLYSVFADAENYIKAYIKEDKYNVSKHQTMSDVACMLQCRGLKGKDLETDLSVYNWFRDEEPTYPREAPFENIRVSHDVGMEHYAKTRCRWKVSKKDMRTWRHAATEAYICDLERRLTGGNGRGKGELGNTHAPATGDETLVEMSRKRPRHTLADPQSLIRCENTSVGKSKEDKPNVDLV